MNKIGIDLGTSFSTICCFNPKSNIPEVIRDENGLDKIPTVVYWGIDGIKVGQAALDIFQESCDLGDEIEKLDVQGRIFKSSKQDFFPDRKYILPDGFCVKAVDIAAAVLGYLKEQAERRAFNGAQVSAACITHPVSFTIAQRRLLEEAAHKAGFEKIELLEEPVAAALGYAISAPGTVGNNILVYDLGGGTLDIALVHRSDDLEYNLPVPPLGDAHCGGDNFDESLYDFFEKQLGKGKSFSSIPDTWDLKVLDECRKFKEALSRREKAIFRINNDEIHFKYEMTRDEFNSLIQEKVQCSVKLLNKVVDTASQAGFLIDTVILIGGSSRIPLIKTVLKEKLPLTPLETMRDDVAVAMGAAVDLPEMRRQHLEKKERIAAEEKRREQEKQKKLQEQKELEEKKRKLAEEQRQLEEAKKQAELEKKQSAEDFFQQAQAYSKATPPNHAEALILYRKAAELGHAYAQFNLAMMYDYGISVDTNKLEAMKWYTAAAEQDLMPVAMRLAEMWTTGQGGTTNLSEGAKWYKRAADLGNMNGMFELGYCYYEGRGVRKDFKSAVECFTKAAATGHDNALYYLGLCYESGFGVEKSEGHAFELFKKAAAKGHIRAGIKIQPRNIQEWWVKLWQ